jgi:hypothetical protein
MSSAEKAAAQPFCTWDSLSQPGDAKKLRQIAALSQGKSSSYLRIDAAQIKLGS